MNALNLSEENPKVKGGYLQRKVAQKKEEVAGRKRELPIERLRALASRARPVRPWAEALRGRKVAVIAEIKRRSPSAGRLEPGLDPASRARLYQAGGAAAVSVLTDRDFGGEMADLAAVAAAVERPVLRKDFLVDPWQVWESRAAGADAALLIVAALETDGLVAVTRAAKEAGLGLLVEVHEPAEFPRALALEPEVVGVNARDLQTLDTDPAEARHRLAALRRLAGPEIVLVAESGIATADDVRLAREAGADAVLVGEALLRAQDPGRRLEELVAAGVVG